MRKVAGGLRSRLSRRKLASEPEAAEGGEAKRTVVDRELKLCSELEFLCSEFGKSVQHTMRLLVRFWRALQRFGADAFEPEEARIVEENFMALRRGLDSTSLSVFHTLMQTKGLANKSRKSLRELEPKLVARDKAWVQKEHYSNKVAEIRSKLSEQNLAGRPIQEEQLKKLQMNEAKRSEAQDAYEVAKVETWAFGKTRKDLVAILILTLDTITRDWFICAGDQVSTALRTPPPADARHTSIGRQRGESQSHSQRRESGTEDPSESFLGSSSQSSFQARPFEASDVDLGEDIEIDLGSPFCSLWHCRTAAEETPLLPSFWNDDEDGEGEEEGEVDEAASPSKVSAGSAGSPSDRGCRGESSPEAATAPTSPPTKYMVCIDTSPETATVPTSPPTGPATAAAVGAVRPPSVGRDLADKQSPSPLGRVARPELVERGGQGEHEAWQSEVRSMQEEMRALLQHQDADRRAQQELMDQLKSSLAGSSGAQGSRGMSEQGQQPAPPATWQATQNPSSDPKLEFFAAVGSEPSQLRDSQAPLSPEQEADRWKRKLGRHLAQLPQTNTPFDASLTQEAHDDVYCLRVTVAYLNEVETELKATQRETWRSDLRSKSEARQANELRDELHSEVNEVDRLQKLVNPDVRLLMEELRDAQVETKKAEMRAAAAARCWGR